MANTFFYKIFSIINYLCIWVIMKITQLVGIYILDISLISLQSPPSPSRFPFSFCSFLQRQREARLFKRRGVPGQKILGLSWDSWGQACKCPCTLRSPTFISFGHFLHSTPVQLWENFLEPYGATGSYSLTYLGKRKGYGHVTRHVKDIVDHDMNVADLVL